jgi:hypothetical protein
MLMIYDKKYHLIDMIYSGQTKLPDSLIFK